MCEGIADELRGIDLGDERLNKRSIRVMESLAANPEASINGACNGWSETLGAYRFFNNEAVTPLRILEPHRQATQARIAEVPVVIIAQDTTELDFSKHPPEGVRCLNVTHRHGLYHHVNLAVTPEGLPLGILETENFDRDPETVGKKSKKKRTKIPIEEKESYRWLKGYRLSCEVAKQCLTTRIVSIGDREADIYDIYVEAQLDVSVRADFIIRAKEERSTLERNPEAGRAAYHKVRDQVSQSPLLTTRVIELPSTPKRKARQATLEVRALRVAVKPPHARSRMPSVILHVVLIQEVGGPGDGTDVSWLLITSLPIDTVEEVLRIIDYYVARWAVEIYFKTLKTGCRVENIQLETKERLEKCLAMYNIIAWRILYLTFMNRTCPTVPCTAVFDEAEWKSVWTVVAKKPLPKQPPTLSEFTKLVAQLGGYNNRAKEAPPGPQCIWIGIRRMIDFANAWLTFGPERGTCE